MRMSPAVKDFLVYVIELCAERFFGGNKTVAYNNLKKTDQLSFYKETYDTSHTLSSEYILEEIKETFAKCGIAL
jgi:hypothetical protein